MNGLSEWTTLTATSRRLGVTVQTLRAWVARGLLRAVRDDSGRHHLLRTDVDRIARQRGARSKHQRGDPRADQVKASDLR